MKIKLLASILSLLIVQFSFSQEHQNQKQETSVTDIDGNIYKTVKIGNQEWMAENLRVEKYNDGTAINIVLQSWEWASNVTTKPMMCYYENNLTNKATYGAMYNWYVLSSTTNGGKNVCPSGWHVPSSEEWMILKTYIGANTGKKLKSRTGWKENGNGTDIYGFSAVPGGYRFNYGDFYYIGSLGYWWSSTSSNTSHAWSCFLDYDGNSMYRNSYDKQFALSVRCVKD